MSPVQISLYVILGAALAISVVTDLIARRILDWITLPALVLALALRAVAQGWGDLEQGFLSGLVSAAGAMAVFAVVAWRGNMGWGDVKLAGVMGAAFGYPRVVAGLVFITLVGALQAVVTLLWQGAFWETLAAAGRRWAIRAHLLQQSAAQPERRHIPYGVAIALGSVWAMIWRANG